MRMSRSTTRRTFLRQLGISGVGLVAVPHLVPERAWSAGGASQRLNMALLACGGRMRQLLPSILQSGENIVAICDVDRREIARLIQGAGKRLPAGKSLENVKVYEDYRKLLEKEKAVDAVVIAPGQRWHVPMSKAAMLAGKHVFCEKPLCHSCAEAREIQQLAQRMPKLVTQVGSQGGSTDTFRRSMEVIQAGLLGKIREVHCWINRGFPPSAPVDQNADPIPAGLNWDFWCGPSRLLPFKNYYLGGCLAWGRWLEFGDGHLADMGAHGLNLPWRALRLGAPLKVSVEIPEPLKDSYPSASTFRWEFAARGALPPVTLWWHDGAKAGPPAELGNKLLTTYKSVPTNGVLFAGEKGILFSDAWGVGGVVRLNDDPRCRGVLDHEAAKSIPVTLPRAQGQNHMQEFLDACKGLTKTFQGFDSAACVAEIAMVGIVALRLGRPIEWDSANLKVQGVPEADPLVHRPQRSKWL